MSVRRVALLCLMTLVAVAVSAVAREDTKVRFHEGSPAKTSLDRLIATPLSATASSGTTVLGYWDFTNPNGSCDTEGWTSADRTTQVGDFFHVDDFAGLGGGTFGRLFALEGNKSLWCGARPDPVNRYTCGYATLPGYGNSWNQAFCTADCLNPLGTVMVDFLVSYDVEPRYDYFYLQYDECDDNWVDVFKVDGIGASFESHTIAPPPSGELRLRFRFTSDVGWSDEDGLWETDGAVIIDSLTVSDAMGQVLSTERFETETLGATATASGNWQSCTPDGYGDFAALFSGLTVVQEDPCRSLVDCMWGFFNGSTVNYACGGWPGQQAVPRVNERDQYIWNEVWSPLLPLVGAGSQIELHYELYEDLPLDNLIFHVNHIRGWVDGCPDRWRDRNFVFYGTRLWSASIHSLGDLVDPAADYVQVAVGVRDMCQFWCGIYYYSFCHSHAPLINWVKLLRIDSNGPLFSVEDSGLFQDTFASNGTLTGTARADMATDVLPRDNPGILPGDSAVVTVADLDDGLTGDPYTGLAAAVYCYVSVWPQGQPGKGGDALTQDSFRWPVVDSLTHGGNTWYCIRTDTSFNAPANARAFPVTDEFCVDLNDNLFTPGDTICFFFCAQSGPPSSKKTYWTPFTGNTPSLDYALTNPDEFTILPAGGYNNGGDILYIDDFDGRGAQIYVDAALRYWGEFDRTDRYDVRGPSSSVGNGIGSRVVDVFQQIIPCYRRIIWNSGDISRGTIGDGTGNPEKSNDAYMLYTFLDQSPNRNGLYLSGDDLANEWSWLSGTDAFNLRNYIQHTLVNDDHEAFGLGVSPLGVGEFPGVFGPDSLIAFGGCPTITNYDVIASAGPAQLAMSYHGNGLANGAVVTQVMTNAAGFESHVALSGFSFHGIHSYDTRTHGYTPDYIQHMGRILNWMGGFVFPVDVPDKTAYHNSLDQNYPNPFNPTTTIRYTLAEPGRVQLKIYNVAGQLVRTLVDEQAQAGIQYDVEWNGHSDAGAHVASGVYFYRLTAKAFTRTRKMVLLK